MTEKELRWAFRSYPSVVTIPQMKKMLDVKKDHTLYKFPSKKNRSQDILPA